MPPTTRTYYRNYDSSDTTSVSYGGTASTFAYISDLGWTAPSGKRFKEWTFYRDGTGGAFTPGEDTGEAHESVYTVYAIWEDIIPYLVTDEELVSVADAIRAKGGTSALLSWPTEYVEAIEDIQTGGGGGQETHSVTCSDGFYVASQTPGVNTPQVTEMDFAPGATVYIFHHPSASTPSPVVKASNGTTLEPTGHLDGFDILWWSYIMPNYCVTAGNAATSITTHHVLVESENSIIFATADNSDPFQFEGECVVNAPVFLVTDGECSISTNPDTEPWQIFESDYGVFWYFVMPDSDVVIYEE